ncbi:MAG: hypothetical protein QOK36_3768 [Gaiellales bacterium]|nr:hypothetical protein [Gaiellales bacterium]
MGFLRALNDAIDRNTVSRSWRRSKQVDWAAWAARNGWTYQAQAPELANTWRDFDGIEDYRHLMTTTLHDRPLTSFQCIAHAHLKWGDSPGVMGVNGFLVVQLPAAVAEPYASQRMHKTLRSFGVQLPAWYNAQFQNRDLIAVRNGLHDPKRLQGEADWIARLVSMAPPDFWRP